MHARIEIAWELNAIAQGRGFLAATTVRNKAIFDGGENGSSTTFYDTVDIYDPSLGTWSQRNLSEGRAYLCATTLGGKALFAGGWSRPRSMSHYVIDVIRP
ncbi:MAG: hypothetical protein ACI835_003390 [Planctomycetota bacterium]